MRKLFLLFTFSAIAGTQILASEYNGINFRYESNDRAEVTECDYPLKYSGDITIPNAVPDMILSDEITCPVVLIADNAFNGCNGITSLKFEGVACQDGIGDNSFSGVGSIGNPVPLTLPYEWKDELRPESPQTSWHGGYFEVADGHYADFKEYKDSIMAELEESIKDYSDDEAIQAMADYWYGKISAAGGKAAIDGAKEDASAVLEKSIAIYISAQDAVLGPMGTAQTGCAAVEVTNDGKTVTLYAPETVKIIKIPANED